MSDIDPATVAHNVAVVRDRIERAAGPRPVELLAVTKTFSAAAIAAAMAAGCRGIGENYAQELVGKVSGIPLTERPEIHFIGRLQTNKVKMLAGVVDVFETVDRPSLVAELARRVPGARCFVQVNVSDEPQKGGCAESAAPAVVEAARGSGLTVMGLMTIGATGRPEDARPGFRRLRALADTLGLEHCSMGMSADLEVAVQEGATLVRVGSALFGPRVRRHDDRAR
jgi:PLP dependent protein